MNREMMAQARGAEPAGHVLRGGRVFNVFTGELLRADVAICGSAIVGVGDYRGREETDVSGKVIVPGFIDAHMHIESSMVTPARLAGEALPWGTTTLIADPHEIANVAGLAGIHYFLEQAAALPMNLFIMLPSCVPATPFEHSGAALDARALASLRGLPHVLGLGEVMDYKGVISGDARVHEKLDAFAEGMIDGHAPLLAGHALQAYRCAGIATDHECATPAELLEKLRAGFFVLIREGSAAHNLEALVRCVLENGLGWDLMAFCTDDKHIEDIRRDGHIRHNIRRAIGLGVPPAQCYRMGSFNAARAYGLRGVGAVAPGYRADIVVLDDFEGVDVHSVYTGGQLVTGPLCRAAAAGGAPCPGALRDTVRLAPMGAAELRLRLTRNPTPVISLLPGQIATRALLERVPEEGGCFVPGGEYRKLAVIERHHATGRRGLGILKGFPIRGAIASTVAHDSHNLIVAGDNDADMLLAINALARCGGGYALACAGRVAGVLPLPIGGLITDADADDVVATLRAMAETAHRMGVPPECEPFITLSFLALPVLPELRVTDMGLFDVGQYEFISN